jgi:hypothetical protein
MPDSTQSIPALFDPSELASTAAAFCGRCGEPNAEANRLLSLREVLCASRELIQALEDFSRSGTRHFHGVHCDAGMTVEVVALARALAQWSESLSAAGSAHRDWQGGRGW